MTAIDAYLARERETLRTATPRPWKADRNDHGDGYVYGDGFQYLLERGGPGGPLPRPPEAAVSDAEVIVSAVNDREALLNIAEAADGVVASLILYESGVDEAHLIESCENLRAVLSRLTADSEGMGT